MTLVRIHSTLRGKLRTLLLFGFFFPLCSPNPHIHTGTLEAVHGSSSLHFFIHSAFNATSVCVLVAQSCPTLCDPMDCSSPGFSIHGNFQAGILEWVPFNAHRHREKTLYCELTDMRPILGAREERKPTNRKPVVSPPNRGTSAAPRLGLPEQGAADRSVPLRNLVASQRL